MKTLYALYSDPESARRAVDTLESAAAAAGFGRGDIAVVSSEPFDGYSFFQTDHKTAMPRIAALGGIVGGALGFWLSAYTQNAYLLPTGGMPIVPLWTDGIITYEMTMLGAILTTLLCLLITTRLPTWKRPIYDPEIPDGKILVGVVNAPEASRATIEKNLIEAGAEAVKEFSG